MSVFITTAILLFGGTATLFAWKWAVKKYGRQILPWTREAREIRRIQRERELQEAVRKALMGFDQKDRDEWEDKWKS
jgi:hypothetical protein